MQELDNTNKTDDILITEAAKKLDNKDEIQHLSTINKIITTINKEKDFATSLRLICEIIPNGYTYPEEVMVRITLDNQQFTSKEFNETSWLERQPIKISGKVYGWVEVFLTKEYIKKVDKNIIIKETALLESIATIVSGQVSKYQLENILYQNTERVKELTGINQARQILKKSLSLEESLQKICNLLPEAWQYPDYTAARITLGEKTYITKNFKETNWVQRQSFETPDNKTGIIEIFYLKDFPELDEGPFLKEERNLIDNLAALISGSASQKVLQKLLYDNTERLKELKGINQISAILKKGRPVEESLQLICSIIPDAWQYPEYTVARITYDGKVYTSKNFKETTWSQKQEFRTPNKKKGLLEVFYTKEFPESYEGPFLKEERDLIINLTNLIAGSATKEILSDLLSKNKERLKELKAINQTSAIIAEGRAIPETLQKIVNILPASWQYPKYTTARIMYEGKIYLSKNFSESKWFQRENFITIDSKKGSIEVFYTKEFPTLYEGPFLKEERNLIINIGKLVSGYINHYKGREALINRKFGLKTDTSKHEEYRKSLINNKQPLQLFFNKQVIDKYIYLEMMKYKVKEILFVATLYDSFILGNEDSFFEQFMGIIYQYSLFSLPRITGVASEEEAVEIIDTTNFDLVIVMVGIDNNAPIEISKKIKEKKPELPVYLLLNKKSNAKYFEEIVPTTNSIDKLFAWSGNSQIFFAIVKSIEDNANAENDTKIGLVRIILLIEDSAQYYSKYLQFLYSIVFEHVQKLLPEVEKNELDKICKMRSRPKILHAKNYEEATYIFNKYKDFMLCVISDIEFEKNGLIDKNAGIKFTKFVRSQIKDLPVILQSSGNTKRISKKLDVEFIDKNSESLLNDLRAFLTNRLFLGNFIFRDKEGNQIAEAKSLREFETLLYKIPEESLYLHGQENQFSLWLMSRGEIELAHLLNPVKVTDFESMEHFRSNFISALQKYREEKKRGKVLSFDETPILNEKNIIRFSSGSLGGKGRGLAFLNALINNLDSSPISKEIKVRVPITAIIGTDEFENFIKKYHIIDLIFKPDITYREIQEYFLKCNLSSALIKKLEVFIDQIKKPVAIRSSSISEDSITQPFAGVFDTIIIPNNQKTKKERIKMLADAIKLVYASVYSDNARNYFKAIHHKVEEERMAVVLQELVGNQYDNFYYPHISGIAKSYNYYPVANMQPEEGFAMAAVGLGSYVVSGKKSYRFSQKYPKIDMYTIKDLLNTTQVEFLAVDLAQKDINLLEDGEFASLKTLDISTAESHGTLKHSASVYVMENERVESGLNARGPRIINFANILKYDYIPLAQTIEMMLNTIKDAFGSSVEIEYAVDLEKSADGLPSFYLLQVKPLVVDSQLMEMPVEKINEKDIILYTQNGLGNGIINTIEDIIYIDIQKFDKLKTFDMVKEIEYLNNKMVQECRQYVLIGPGRWGTRDKFLGIPVNWSQISMAKVIVEISLANFPLDSSLGSHFFHNVTSMNIGYFSVQDSSTIDYIKWDTFGNQHLIESTQHFRHIRFEKPLEIIMLGKQKTAYILNK